MPETWEEWLEQEDIADDEGEAWDQFAADDEGETESGGWEEDIDERIIEPPPSDLQKIWRGGKFVEAKQFFTHRWGDRWCWEHDYTRRAVHAQRRSAPDQVEVAAFYTQVVLMFRWYSRKMVFNMDETCWRVVNGTLRTIARVGTETVNLNLDTSLKESLTAIGGISAEGVKLPIWVICKGKTDRCENRFRNDPELSRSVRNGRVVFVHTQSGWANEEICIFGMASDVVPGRSDWYVVGLLFGAQTGISRDKGTESRD
jgi:hypothetical protein